MFDVKIGGVHKVIIGFKLSRPQVILATYTNIIQRSKNRSDNLNIKWWRIILDEGHAIKNPTSQRSSVLSTLTAAHKLVMTGTPIHNGVEDICAVIGWLGCDVSNSFLQSKRRSKTLKNGIMNHVEKIVDDVLLRRQLTDVAADCPACDLPNLHSEVTRIRGIGGFPFTSRVRGEFDGWSMANPVCSLPPSLCATPRVPENINPAPPFIACKLKALTFKYKEERDAYTQVLNIAAEHMRPGEVLEGLENVSGRGE